MEEGHSPVPDLDLEIWRRGGGGGGGGRECDGHLDPDITGKRGTVSKLFFSGLPLV